MLQKRISAYALRRGFYVRLSSIIARVLAMPQVSFSKTERKLSFAIYSVEIRT